MDLLTGFPIIGDGGVDGFGSELVFHPLDISLLL